MSLMLDVSVGVHIIANVGTDMTYDFTYGVAVSAA